MSSKDKKINKAQTARNPWAIARTIVDESGKDGPHPLWGEYTDPNMDEDDKRALMGKIVAGIQSNKWNKSMDNHNTPEPEHTEQSTTIQKKIDPAIAALAGWWFGGDVARGVGAATPAQQREFERQIQQAMRKKGRRLRKDDALEKMQQFFNTKDNADTYVRKTPVKNAVTANTFLEKVLSIPPFAGARFDPATHRWTKPENVGQTVQARGGKKRVRATGTGAGERSVSGHGKGRIRGEGAVWKFKGETDLASSRRKEKIGGSMKSKAKKRAATRVKRALSSIKRR